MDDWRPDYSEYEGHTPGPWLNDYGYIGPNENVSKPAVAHVYDWERNGQLIADAPKLLDYCKRLEQDVRDMRDALESAISPVEAWANVHRHDYEGRDDGPLHPVHQELIDKISEMLERTKVQR